MEELTMEEVVLYKDKSKNNRIKRTKNAIKRRKRKIYDLLVNKQSFNAIEFGKIGDSYFENNSICNAMLGKREKVKTKSKHGCQTYRHHNVYGKAVRYTNHDLKQIANLKYELKDNNMNNYIKGGEKA